LTHSLEESNIGRESSLGGLKKCKIKNT